MMKINYKLSGIMILSLLLIISCTEKNNASPDSLENTEPTNLKVGFSQMNHTNPWRVAETNDMKQVAEKLGIQLYLRDANSSQTKQILHIEEFIGLGMDYIICTPIVEEGWERAFQICREAGIPLIMLDREAIGVAGEDFLTFVGSDFVEEAERAALWLAEQTDNSAKIIELRGREGASCVRDRASGFRKVIDEIPDMYIVAYEYADFERITGQMMMEQMILSYGREFDAVYAHNDEMAIGAIQALKAADLKPGEDIIVVSIDGSKDALKSIMAGTLSASIECTPYLADETFNAILAHQAGEPVPAKVIVKDRRFDIENAYKFIDQAF